MIDVPEVLRLICISAGASFLPPFPSLMSRRLIPVNVCGYTARLMVGDGVVRPSRTACSKTGCIQLTGHSPLQGWNRDSPRVRTDTHLYLLEATV
jgi:hypothetical protein